MIIGITRGLGLRLIAECVESGPQRDLLLELGCPLWQGGLFGEPAPLAEFEAHLGSALDAPKPVSMPLMQRTDALRRPTAPPVAVRLGKLTKLKLGRSVRAGIAAAVEQDVLPRQVAGMRAA